MAFFQVMLEGKDFLIEFDGKIEMIGFVTTRWVKADTSEKAELFAVELVKTDESLVKMMHNTNGDEPLPMIYLEEMAEVSWFQYWRRSPGTGYSFYRQDVDEFEKS